MLFPADPLDAYHADFGLLPDRAIAVKANVEVWRVFAYRKKRGIPPPPRSEARMAREAPLRAAAIVARYEREAHEAAHWAARRKAQAQKDPAAAMRIDTSLFAYRVTLQAGAEQRRVVVTAMNVVRALKRAAASTGSAWTITSVRLLGAAL